VAPVEELAARIRDRCDGVIDRVLVGFPASFDEDTIASVVADLRRPFTPPRSS